MKDFGNDAFSDGCFDTVWKLKNLNCGNPKDFVGILKIINYDLHLGVSGDDNCASPVISMLPRPVRKSKLNLTPQPENPKKIKPYSIVQQLFSTKKRNFGNNTASCLKS
jgi:hypothetical protein